MYAIRPARAKNTPKLQGIYIFGPMDSSANDLWQTTQCQASLRGEGSSRQDEQWFERTGRMFAKEPDAEWSHTIKACQGIISFDAVLCQGPSHSLTVSDVEGSKSAWYTSPGLYTPPRVATHALGGCDECGKSPESFGTMKSSSIEVFPLLAPVPLHSSNTKAAKMPNVSQLGLEKKLLVRCSKCLKNRYCECCHKWWCEDCYQPESQGNRALSRPPNFNDVEQKIANKRNKVHVGLCTKTCLREDLASGAGTED